MSHALKLKPTKPTQLPEPKAETILITGNAGFVGSNLTERLLKEGYTVIGIDNFRNNDFDKTKYFRKEDFLKSLKKNPNFHHYDIDIRGPKLSSVFESHKIDKVIHLAALAGVRKSIENPVAYVDTNELGLVRVLDNAKNHQVKRFVFASSSSVYGNCQNTPWREHEINLKPISPYATTKLAGEIHCETYHNLFGMNMVVLRFFSVYGKRGRMDMAPYLFMDAITTGKPITKFGDGSMARDWTNINDIVDGIMASLKFDNTRGFEIINLGNSYPITLNELIETIEDITGKTAKIIHKPQPKEDVEKTYADITKAKKLLGYIPKVPLTEGLKRFYESDFKR